MTENKKGFNLYFDKEICAVVMEWAGYFTSEQFKKGTEQMLEQLKQYKANKVLALISNMVLIGMEEQQWMQASFLPRAIQEGFKVCAILNPHNYFNKVAIENIKFKTDQRKLAISVFDTEDEARRWLRNF